MDPDLPMYGKCVPCPKPYLITSVAIIIELTLSVIAVRDGGSADRDDDDNKKLNFKKEFRYFWTAFTFCRFIIGLTNDIMLLSTRLPGRNNDWNRYQCMILIFKQSANFKLFVVTGLLHVIEGNDTWWQDDNTMSQNIRLFVAIIFGMGCAPAFFTHVIPWLVVYCWMLTPLLAIWCLAYFLKGCGECCMSEHDATMFSFYVVLYMAYIYGVDVMISLYGGVNYFDTMTYYSDSVSISDWVACVFAKSNILVAIANFITQVI